MFKRAGGRGEAGRSAQHARDPVGSDLMPWCLVPGRSAGPYQDWTWWWWLIEIPPRPLAAFPHPTSRPVAVTGRPSTGKETNEPRCWGYSVHECKAGSHQPPATSHHQQKEALILSFPL